MAKVNRVSWERESYFDDLYGAGIIALARHKFIYLAGQANMCPAVFERWLEHWREYVEDANEDLEILMVGETVVLWRVGMQRKNGEPKPLSKALASSN